MEVMVSGFAMSFRQAAQVKDAVGEPVLAQVLPDVLDGVELWGARRQEDHGDVPRDREGSYETVRGDPGRGAEGARFERVMATGRAFRRASSRRASPTSRSGAFRPRSSRGRRIQRAARVASRTGESLGCDRMALAGPGKPASAFAAMRMAKERRA